MCWVPPPELGSPCVAAGAPASNSGGLIREGDRFRQWKGRFPALPESGFMPGLRAVGACFRQEKEPARPAGLQLSSPRRSKIQGCGPRLNVTRQRSPGGGGFGPGTGLRRARLETRRSRPCYPAGLGCASAVFPYPPNAARRKTAQRFSFVRLTGSLLRRIIMTLRRFGQGFGPSRDHDDTTQTYSPSTRAPLWAFR